MQAKRRNTQGSIEDAPTPASTVSDADIEAAVSLMDDAFIQAIRDISPVSFSSSTGNFTGRFNAVKRCKGSERRTILFSSKFIASSFRHSFIHLCNVV